MTQPSLPQRKSPRLQGYDYSQAGAYFITICTHHRAHLFGNIQDGEMLPNRAGEITIERWYDLLNHHHGIELDAFVVMPNHVHGIVVIIGDADDKTAATPKLGTVIGSYKSGVTRCIREALNNTNLIVWQGSYHDHIIRNEHGLNTLREYILNNPACWQQDTFYA